MILWASVCLALYHKIIISQNWKTPAATNHLLKGFFFFKTKSTYKDHPLKMALIKPRRRQSCLCQLDSTNPILVLQRTPWWWSTNLAHFSRAIRVYANSTSTEEKKIIIHFIVSEILKRLGWNEYFTFRARFVFNDRHPPIQSVQKSLSLGFRNDEFKITEKKIKFLSPISIL